MKGRSMLHHMAENITMRGRFEGRNQRLKILCGSMDLLWVRLRHIVWVCFERLVCQGLYMLLYFTAGPSYRLKTGLLHVAFRKLSQLIE